MYTLLKYFCNQSSIGIHFTPGGKVAMQFTELFLMQYYMSFPVPQYLRFMWLSRLNQKVQIVSSPTDGLHGLLMAGISQVHAANLQKRKNM